MLTRQLTSGERIVRTVSVVLSLIFVAGVILELTGQGAVGIVRNDTSSYLAFMMVLLGLASLAITILNIRSLVTGTVNLRWQPKVIAWAAFLGVLLASSAPIAIGFVFGDKVAVVHMMLVCAILLIAVTAKVILVYIEQSELNVREKLLEIELQLAEISEQMQKSSRDAH